MISHLQVEQDLYAHTEDPEEIPVSEVFITSLERKLGDYSELLSQMQDKDLRKLLEFLFFYLVENPNASPWNKTIAKQFDLHSESKTMRDDIRRFLYAVRLIKSISIDKQLIDKTHPTRSFNSNQSMKKTGILIASRGVWLRQNKDKSHG
ncbi:MAG: hypothetical protein JSV85_02665 [Candidatus Bathyarchaeota archaeon]|nr:MAG: hypothetical protein JSV85_02665 [Candidatus Bathyarchaeota archaeon]